MTLNINIMKEIMEVTRYKNHDDKDEDCLSNGGK